MVVFENGLAGRLDWWAKVYPEIAQETSALAYNRPGYGKSAVATTPRDGDHVVEELRALLREQGLAPPYLLVGHSLGGLYMQLFARRYPGEVSGLILVDSTHPRQSQGRGAPEHWPAWVRLLTALYFSATEQEELDAINATGDAVLALPPYTAGPVLVLSAAKPLSQTSELAQDANEKRRDLALLHPGCRQVWVDSDHGIPLEKPEAVLEAIREILAQQRTNQ